MGGSPTAIPVNKPPRSAFIFFDDSDHPHLFFLKKGFRHCGLAWFDEHGHWLTLDPLFNFIEIVEYPYLDDGFDLQDYMQGRGFTTVGVQIQRPKPKWHHTGLGLFTCVEVVKRAAGIPACWIITPWQLYQYVRSR